MATEYHNQLCDVCGRDRIFYRHSLHHKLHLFLSLLTGGLWLVSWMSLIFNQKHRPWSCTVCDAKRERLSLRRQKKRRIVQSAG